VTLIIAVLFSVIKAVGHFGGGVIFGRDFTAMAAMALE
jgi:hypothetical protein